MAAEPTPPVPPTVTAAGPTSDERTVALMCHVGGFLTWILLPLILWQIKKDQSRFIDEHGKEALNFQIAVTIYYLVGCVLIVMWIPVMIYEIVVVIKAALAANRGEMYRYPFNIRFIK
jgi:hypothetical protein